jgi:hypothetical protein
MWSELKVSRSMAALSPSSAELLFPSDDAHACSIECDRRVSQKGTRQFI